MPPPPPPPSPSVPLSNHHTIITGGTGALGTAVVASLIEQGATCHIPCHHESELKHFPAHLASHERVQIVRGVDLTDEASVEKFYAAVPALWSSIHIAGGFAYAPIQTMSKADFVHLMQMNMLTCFLCSREAVKRMDAGQSGGGAGGRIVNVAARAALEPRTGANMSAYTAAKSAVAGFTQALAEEVIGRGILVNAVLPSIMDTPQNRKDMPTADFTKWAKVEDVAATIAFLASPHNTVTRGGLVPVYGGT